MSEHLQDITSLVPNEISRSDAQHQNPLSYHAAPLHERLPPEIFVAIADASFLWGTIGAAEGLLAVHKALQTAKDASLDIDYLSETSRINQTEFSQACKRRDSSVEVVGCGFDGVAIRLGRLACPKASEVGEASRGYDILQRTSEQRRDRSIWGGDPCPGLKDVRVACVGFCCGCHGDNRGQNLCLLHSTINPFFLPPQMYILAGETSPLSPSSSSPLPLHRRPSTSSVKSSITQRKKLIFPER